MNSKNKLGVLGVILVLGCMATHARAEVEAYERDWELGPVLKKNGKAITPAQKDADRICKEHGYVGLPTIRQVVEVMNPQGIHTTQHRLDDVIGSEGINRFYYDPLPYPAPARGTEGYHDIYLTSSEHPGYPGEFYNFIFDGGDIGKVGREDTAMGCVVRCVKAR